MSNQKICQECGAAPALINLATAENAAPGAPDHWLCAKCFTIGMARAAPLQQADEDAAEYRDQGGRLN
jgi:hypothetical protein